MTAANNMAAKKPLTSHLEIAFDLQPHATYSAHYG